MLRHAGTREVLAVRGEEALLRLIVCADPRPKRALWEWGSEFVETGKPNGRYRAELIDDEREDCYEARLYVQDVEPSDSRSYYLAVENEKGSDRHAVHLTVRGEYSRDGESTAPRTSPTLIHLRRERNCEVHTVGTCTRRSWVVVSPGSRTVQRRSRFTPPNVECFAVTLRDLAKL